MPMRTSARLHARAWAIAAFITPRNRRASPASTLRSRWPRVGERTPQHGERPPRGRPRHLSHGRGTAMEIAAHAAGIALESAELPRLPRPVELVALVPVQEVVLLRALLDGGLDREAH